MTRIRQNIRDLRLFVPFVIKICSVLDMSINLLRLNYDFQDSDIVKLFQYTLKEDFCDPQ